MKSIAELALRDSEQRFRDYADIRGKIHQSDANGSEAQVGEPGVIVRAPTKRPVELAIGFLDWKIVDGGEPTLH
jgi:hypothetical protein